MPDLPRRHVLAALATGPLGAVPFAVILTDPHLARAAAAELADVTLTREDGKSVKAALAMPDTAPAPAILLIHEWWGLNDQIKTMAAALAREGYMALAVDLYDGKVATDREAAQRHMQAVDPAEAKRTLAAWIGWLREHPQGTGKIGTIGWCFGGGWSLTAATLAPVDAAVVYYGRVNQPAAELAALEGPVLGHFATRDGWINAEMVAGFEAAMRSAGKPFEVHWYEADHAFANPTGARHDAADAELAWRRTLDFFAAHLKAG